MDPDLGSKFIHNYTDPHHVAKSMIFKLVLHYFPLFSMHELTCYQQSVHCTAYTHYLKNQVVLINKIFLTVQKKYESEENVNVNKSVLKKVNNGGKC